jgi:hypothetical protein
MQLEKTLKSAKVRESIFSMKTGHEAPRPDSVTGISYSSKPKVAT